MQGAVWRRALKDAFGQLMRMADRPVLYAIPWQEPAGASYEADVDAWLSDADGSVVTVEPSSLDYYAIPAMWGADADLFTLAMGGLSTAGRMNMVALAQYQPQLNGAMMVVAGSLDGDQYTLGQLENAPDGMAVFVTAGMTRREA